MRYADVIERFAAAREATSREWTISPSLIMCVELDMSGDALFDMPVHSSRSGASSFLRITYFRENIKATRGWVAIHDLALMSLEEAAQALVYRDAIGAWVGGYAIDLPRSSSTVIAERLRRKR